MTPADVAKVDADLKLNGRIDRDSWVSQARGFVESAAAV
jgi:small subunit ribosomal protein S2